jgi:hypothetical protein
VSSVTAETLTGISNKTMRSVLMTSFHGVRVVLAIHEEKALTKRESRAKAPGSSVA